MVCILHLPSWALMLCVCVCVCVSPKFFLTLSMCVTFDRQPAMSHFSWAYPCWQVLLFLGSVMFTQNGWNLFMETDLLPPTLPPPVYVERLIQPLISSLSPGQVWFVFNKMHPPPALPWAVAMDKVKRCFPTWSPIHAQPHSPWQRKN